MSETSPQDDAPLHEDAGLALDDVSCRRGGRMVFEGLSTRLTPGAALLVRGANGAGKSSLLRLLAGFSRPAAGQIAWNGEDIWADPEAHRARLHYLGHLDPIKPQLKVIEHLAFWAEMKGHQLPLQNALNQFGLGGLAQMPARTLSAGQRRRLNLARLGASGAPLWVLDEPTVALDEASVTALEELIVQHRQMGGIVILASHISVRLEGAGEINLNDYQPQDAERDVLDVA